MTLEEYFGDWNKVVDKVELIKVINKLDSLYKTKSITPDKNKVFKAFSLCKYSELKIVFIGYDPYPQKGVATGILFGNNKEVTEDNLSPSLKIIKEAVINYELSHNNIIFDNTLESWARQGILMLNSALTTEVNKTGSHIIIWRPFISKLLINLSINNPGLIYVLFGNNAQTFIPYISKLNTILKIEHPAYFARINKRMPSTIFYNINKLIKGVYNEKIEWYREQED